MQSKKKSSHSIKATQKEDLGHRIGFYIRVSTEEQAENPEGSIRNQEERLKEAVKFKNLSGNFGSIADIFIDRAKSGKNTQRPELQRMLRAIERGEVNLVMVSELSRLSRSIKDFSEMWDLMQSCGCGFLSLRESFDTTTAAGEMVLYSIANIAQFERRQISERVAANMQSRASRGLYNGGVIPAGFSLDPEKRGHLKADTEHVDVVRQAFNALIRERSLSQAAKWLNANGYRIKHNKSRGGGKSVRLSHFTTANLHSMLRNKAVIGIRQYRVKGVTHEVKAAWDPIVDPAIFDRVQEILGQNHSRYKPDSFKRHPYELTGMVFCGQCGENLCGKSAHGNGGKVSYYEHGWLTKKNGCLLKEAHGCQPFRVPATKLEPMVWAEIEKLLKDPERGRRLIESAHKFAAEQSHKGEIDRAQTRVYDVQRQLDTLAERLSLLPPGIDPQPIYRQMERLQGLKREEEDRLYLLKQNSTYELIPAELASFSELIRHLNVLAESSWAAPIRARIAQSLIHQIEIIPTGFRVHFKWTQNEIFQSITQSGQWLQATTRRASDLQDMEIVENLPIEKENHKSKSGTMVFGSRTLTYGGR